MGVKRTIFVVFGSAVIHTLGYKSLWYKFFTSQYICLQYLNVEICWLLILNVPHPGYFIHLPAYLVHFAPHMGGKMNHVLSSKNKMLSWYLGLLVTAVLLLTSFKHFRFKILEMVCTNTPFSSRWFILPPKIFLWANPPKTY